MNTTKLTLALASIALSFGAATVSAAELNIDTLVYKASPAVSSAPRVAFTGKVQSNYDSLVSKDHLPSSKTRAEVRAELAMFHRVQNSYF